MYINGIGLVNANSELNVLGMRRAGRFAKLAAQGAQDAVTDSGVALDGANTGIILATNFGPHVTTFEFLDNILSYSEKEVSPTLFSHSVHNAAAFYIAKALKITGPTLTVTDFDAPFFQATVLAKAWLSSGRCSNVLVGKAEESGNVMNYIAQNMSGKGLEIVEGSLFFLLGKKDMHKNYLALDAVDEKLLSQRRLDLVAKAARLVIQLNS